MRRILAVVCLSLGCGDLPSKGPLETGTTDGPNEQGQDPTTPDAVEISNPVDQLDVEVSMIKLIKQEVGDDILDAPEPSDAESALHEFTFAWDEALVRTTLVVDELAVCTGAVDAEIDGVWDELDLLDLAVQDVVIQSATWSTLDLFIAGDEQLQAAFDDGIAALRDQIDVWQQDGFCEDNDEPG